LVSVQVADDFLQRMTIEVINSLYAGNGDVIRIVKTAIGKVIKSSDDVNLILESKLKEREQLEQTLSDLLDMKLAKSFDATTLEKKYKDTTNQLSELLTNIDELENKYKNVRKNDDRLKRIDQFMEEHKDGITELNSQVLQSFFRIMIMTDDKLMTYVISTKQISDEEIKKDRKKIIDLPGFKEGEYYDSIYNKTMKYKIVLM